MLRERYEPINVFERIPTLTLRMDPVLAHIDTLLDDDTIFQAVKADLISRFPRTATDGRPSTPVEVILRMLVVKHLYNWSFPQTSQFVSDSLVLRQFYRVYFQAVPDQSTLNRWARLFQPATLHRLLDHVVHLALQHQVTHGRKLRVDGTVVETNIHHPSNSTLLNDGVRVLPRTLQRARQAVADAGAVAQQAFTDQTQHARARMKQIMYVARLKGEQAADQLKTAYHDLLDLTQTVVEQAQQVKTQLHEQSSAAAEGVARCFATMPQARSACETGCKSVRHVWSGSITADLHGGS